MRTASNIHAEERKTKDFMSQLSLDRCSVLYLGDIYYLEGASEMPEKIIAWVGTSCRYCGWAGKVEVIKKDDRGKMILRCPQCKERIPHE